MSASTTDPSSRNVPPARVVQTVERVRSGFQKLNQALVPPSVAVMEMVTAAWVSQALYVAAKLGIADVLEPAGLPAAEIAKRVGADAEATGRLLRTLAAHGVFRASDDGKYLLTPMAERLKSDHPESMRSMVLFVGSPEHWEHWGNLFHSVKTGETAVRHLRGMPAWEYLRGNKALAEIFNEAMTNVSSMEIGPVLAAYNFSGYQRIVDVGGGHGRLLAAILGKYPTAKGVLFDQADVVAGSRAVLEGAGVAARCDVDSGSFFEAVPKAGDLYLLKHIIHDWEQGKALEILRNVHKAMLKRGKLLLIEMVLPEGNGAHVGKRLDLEMLVTVGGKERTEREYRELLEQAGFDLLRIIPTAAPVSIVEAAPRKGEA